MKKYNVYELSVVKVRRNNKTHQYFICKYDYKKKMYIEIFTKQKIKISEIDKYFFVDPLTDYFPRAIFNYEVNALMINKKELFAKYNEINYINLYLESDEKTIEDELESRGIFQNSKIYKNRQRLEHSELFKYPQIYKIKSLKKIKSKKL